MTEYKIEMDNYQGTTVTIESTDSIIAKRIELAVEHIFKEFQQKKGECK